VAGDRGSLHAVSLSGGKDSSALLLLMVERGMPIDIVLTADTGMEFPEMYAHLAKLNEYLYRERGIHITTLRHPMGFEWMMFERPVERPPDCSPKGYGWPSGAPGTRWCTGYLKTHLMDKEINRLKKNRKVVNYIGIAADEAWRCKDKVYPLVDWGITEAEALQICYDRGFDFGGLYRIYRRASCWCCPLQRISELKKLRRYHPELWERLRVMDRRAKAQFGENALGCFKQGWSVEQLERRFDYEDRQLSLFELMENNSEKGNAQ